MERVIVSGTDEEAPTFYFNTVDVALMQHYMGEIPENFSFGIVATDDLAEGEVAIEGGVGLTDEARSTFVRYWERGVQHVHMICAAEVAFAQSELEDAFVMVDGDGNTMIVPAEDVVDFESDDGEIEFEDEG